MQNLDFTYSDSIMSKYSYTLRVKKYLNFHWKSLIPHCNLQNWMI